MACSTVASLSASMSLLASSKNGMTFPINRSLEDRACDKPWRKSSPVMPILSPFGGSNVIGKYEERVSKSAMTDALLIHSAGKSSNAFFTIVKDTSKFRGSRSSSIAAATPSPSCGPKLINSECHSSINNTAVSSTIFLTACVWDGVCTSLKMERAMCKANGSSPPPGISFFKVRTRAPWRWSSTRIPPIAPSTHCQSLSFEEKKLAKVSTCLKFNLSCATSLRHSARNWMACLRPVGLLASFITCSRCKTISSSSSRFASKASSTFFKVTSLSSSVIRSDSTYRSMASLSWPSMFDIPLWSGPATERKLL
mmetsp:Transcript_42734/g.99608  ORF Transcript_42734/g.99608 Transcript_42734/m.99608 type:complete len:311 (-) Transcript_42734:38-970(-)